MKSKTTEKHWSTHALMAALRERFPAPEWAFFEEVRDAAGFNARRTTDAIAMNTWVSRGLEIHGFELKQDRRDWLREKGDTLHVVVEAPVRPEPKPVDRQILAVLLRASAESSASAKAIREAVAAAEMRWSKHRGEERSREADRASAEYRTLKAAVDAFEARSGVRIGSYNGPEIGGAVNVILQGGVPQLRRDLTYLLKHARQAATALEEHLAHLTVPLPDEFGTQPLAEEKVLDVPPGWALTSPGEPS